MVSLAWRRGHGGQRCGELRTVPSILFPIFVGLTTAKVKDCIASLPCSKVWPCMTTFLLTGEQKGCVHLPRHLIKIGCFPDLLSFAFHGRNRQEKPPASAMRTRTALPELMEQQDGRNPGPCSCHHQVLLYHVRQKQTLSD